MENVNQPSQLLQKTHDLCITLVESLFGALKDDIKRDPEIEVKCLGIVANFMTMSSGTFQYKEDQFASYIKMTCMEMGYQEKDVERTKVFKYATGLRKLFRGDVEFLKSAEMNLEMQPLPTSKDVKVALGAKFSQLGKIFRDEYDKRVLTTGVEAFIKSKINEILV